MGVYDRAMPEPQSAKNHIRYDPLWHYFVAPVLLINVGVAIYLAAHDWSAHWKQGVWGVILSIALLLLSTTVRGYALKLQDRLVRLEERVRLGSVLTAQEFEALTSKQLTALRFASDAEAGSLARRAIAEQLDAKAIKAAIQSWRPDHSRV